MQIAKQIPFGDERNLDAHLNYQFKMIRIPYTTKQVKSIQPLFPI